MPKLTKKQMLDNLASAPPTDGDAIKQALLAIFEQILPPDKKQTTANADEE
jgi:hypothetical protein